MGKEKKEDREWEKDIGCFQQIKMKHWKIGIREFSSVSEMPQSRSSEIEGKMLNGLITKKNCYTNVIKNCH